MTNEAFTAARPATPAAPLSAETPPPAKRGARRGGGKRGSQGKGGKRKAVAPARAKQTRRGPAALSLDAALAFEIAGTCKKKDMAAINVICAQLSPLNKAGRARVWHAVQMILG